MNPDVTQLYNLLLKLLNNFFKEVKIPTVFAKASRPEKSEEDPSAYVGSSGYLVMFLRAHDFFAQKEHKKSEELLSKSHLVGDEVINQLTDPLFYLKIAEEQYRFLENYILTHKRQNNTFSYYMS